MVLAPHVVSIVEVLVNHCLRVLLPLVEGDWSLLLVVTVLDHLTMLSERESLLAGVPAVVVGLLWRNMHLPRQ